MNNQNCIPVNSVAKRVVQKGIHYDPNFKNLENHYDAPPKKRKVVKDPNCKNFIGHKHGTFTVVGLSEKSNQKKKISAGARWIVKCVCGKYELRSTKALKNHINNPGKYGLDMCRACMDLRKIKIMAQASALGYKYEEFCEKYLPRHK